MAGHTNNKKLTPKQKKKKSEAAEAVKGKPGVKEPFALADAIATGTVKKKKKRIPRK